MGRIWVYLCSMDPIIEMGGCCEELAQSLKEETCNDHSCMTKWGTPLAIQLAAVCQVSLP